MADLSIDDAVGGYLQGTATQIRNNLVQALPVNPDQEAQTKRLASAASVPIDTARNVPDVVKTQAAMAGFDADHLTRQFPNLAQFMTNGDNVRLMHDDVPATAAVEQHVAALGSPTDRIAADAAKYGSLQAGPGPSYKDRLTAWMHDLVGMEPAGRDEGAAARAFLDRTAQQMGTTRQGLREAVGGMSPVPQQFAQGFFDSFLAGLAPDNAGTPDTTSGGVARGTGALAGFMIGAPLKIATMATEKMGGQVLERAAGDSFVKALGKDMTRQAATLGIASGLTAAGQALDASTPDGAVATVMHATESGAGMGAVFGAAGRLFPDNNALQFAARALGINVSLDAMSGARPWDDRPMAQKVFDYGLNTVFALGGAGRTGGGWLHDAARADTAVQDANVLGGIAQASAASKLRERDPDMFKQFVAQAAQDSPVPAVFIDGKQLAESLHQSGIGMDELATKMPEVARQLPEALSTGGQVRIPVEDFATHIAGGPLQDPLMQHLRTDPEGMTLAESQAFYQSHIDELKAEAERVNVARAADLPFQQSRQAVFDNIKGQLEAAGRFRPDVNDAYAALHRDFYTTMAERAGLMPHELLDRYPVRIGAENPAGESLAQSAHLDLSNPRTGPAAALLEAGRLRPDLFQYPKSSARDLAAIAAEKMPGWHVTPETITQMDGSEKPTGIWEVTPPGSAGVAVLHESTGKVWINVAGLEPGDRGSAVYDLAANYAHNNGLKFIGDPAGVSRAAMLRRAENMLSSAVKYGTTDHLEPHPDQLSGNNDIPGIDWRPGDTLHNVRAMMDATTAANAKIAPQAEGLSYDPHTDSFTDEPFFGGGPRAVDKVGIGRMAESGRGLSGAGAPGEATLRRNALFKSLLQGEGERRAFLDQLHDVGSDAREASGSQLDKSFYQGQRGAFDPVSKTIALLEGADLSTFLHESGHFFLDTLADMASRPDAPPAIKADMDVLLKSFGVADLDTWRNMSLDQQRAGHEQFAQGFEKYLLEGKAPNLELRSLFGRFRSWLLNVYKSLSGLGIELTPEVRGVFDRMLASEDAIHQAETARRYMPLFDSPEKAGMSAQDWSAYQALGKDATEQAIEALTGKTLKDMAWLDRARSSALKALASDAAAKRKIVRTEVEAEVDQQPVYGAMRFLKRGETIDEKGNPVQALEGHRLDLDALKAMYPEKAEGNPAWQKLGYGKYGMLGEKGLHPDLVAEMFGFRNGDDLVRSMLDAEPRREVVQGMTDQRMLERHGEIADPQALAKAADDLVHNEVRTRFIATELKTLNKAIGPARDLAKAAKEVAETTIGGKRLREISESQFTTAESKAAKAAEKRLAAGDTAGAAVAKRDQLLNNQLARTARDAIDYTGKSLDYLKKFDRASVREGIDLEYRDQIDALLDRYDLRKSVSNTALDKREALLQFVERMAAQGYEPQIPEKLLDEAQRTHYKDMLFEDFRGLVDAVKSIEHLGKLKTRLLDLKEMREISALADEVKATAAQLPQRAAESNRGLTRMEEGWLNVKSAGRSLQASLLKMEQMFDWLDARNPNGALNRVVFRRIADAGVKENDLLAKVKGEIDKLVESHLPDVTRDGGKIYTAAGLVDGLTGQPQRFTKKQMLMLAGNMGNESNTAKLLKGEGWQEQAVWEFLNAHMSKADWDFVAGMGKALEGLWPEKLAMSRRLGNTNPEKIAPRAFETPHGRYDGWYWPMIYDPARAQDVAERGAKAGDALFENIYSRANTDTGRMNTRNENYARPLLLDLDVIPRVIKDEIHDIAFREAVIDADRFLSNGTVRKAIVDALSQQHYDQIRPWLQSIANDGKSSTESMRALKFFSAVANGARTRATIVGLGYRVSTMLVHGASAGLESVAELGPKWFASGLKDFANPGQWAANRDFIFERSGEMRNRMNEVDRDVREHLRQIDVRMMDPTTGAIARGSDTMKAHAYQGIAMLDMASALPTWMGAYKKAMTPEAQGGLGMTEQNAVYFADKTVRNAHGGTGVKDLAAVQRGPEFFKLFTMFYTFWNHNVNRIMDTARLAKDPATWRDSELAGQVIMRTLVYTIGVQVMHGIFHPPKEGAEEESWLKWAGKEFLSSAFAGIPILRDLSAHYLSGKDYSATPAASMVNAVGNSGTDALNALTGQQPNDRWLKHTMTTAGYVFGLPTGQAASATQFLWDVAADKQHPDTAGDWWNGLLHGDTKHH